MQDWAVAPALEMLLANSSIDRWVSMDTYFPEGGRFEGQVDWWVNTVGSQHFTPAVTGGYNWEDPPLPAWQKPEGFVSRMRSVWDRNVTQLAFWMGMVREEWLPWLYRWKTHCAHCPNAKAGGRVMACFELQANCGEPRPKGEVARAAPPQRWSRMLAAAPPQKSDDVAAEAGLFSVEWSKPTLVGSSDLTHFWFPVGVLEIAAGSPAQNTSLQFQAIQRGGDGRPCPPKDHPDYPCNAELGSQDGGRSYHAAPPSGPFPLLPEAPLLPKRAANPGQFRSVNAFECVNASCKGDVSLITPLHRFDID